MRISADVAELVDALASGASALRGVEVQVLSSAPTSSYPNPPQSKTSGMWSQMMNNAHPPGWALFVLWSSWAHRQRWAVWLRGGVSRALRRVPEPVSARWTGRGVRVGASASAPPPPLASSVPSSPALSCPSCAPGCLPPSVAPSPWSGKMTRPSSSTSGLTSTRWKNTWLSRFFR